MMRALAILFITTLALAGCAPDILSTKPEVRGINKGPSPVVRLTDFDDGRSVSVSPEADLLITLTSNPTTGYSWQLAELDGLAFKSDTYIPDAVAPGIVGAGGVQVFKLTAPSTPGTSTVIFHYQRNPADRISTRRLTVRTVK